MFKTPPQKLNYLTKLADDYFFELLLDIKNPLVMSLSGLNLTLLMLSTPLLRSPVSLH
jgi:hypothetical protein